MEKHKKEEKDTESASKGFGAGGQGLERKAMAKSFRKQDLEIFGSNGTQHRHRPMLQLSDSIPEPYWATSEPPEIQESQEMNKSVSKYVAAPQAPDE